MEWLRFDLDQQQDCKDQHVSTNKTSQVTSSIDVQ